MGASGPGVAWRDMRRCILMLSMVFALGGLRAEVGHLPSSGFKRASLDLGRVDAFFRRWRVRPP